METTTGGNAKQVPMPAPAIEPRIQCRAAGCCKDLEIGSILLVSRYYRITQPGRGYAYLCEECFEKENSRGLGLLEVVKIQPA